MSAADFRPVVPLDGERGLASWERDDLASLVLPAWDAFQEIASTVDMDASTRVDGWSARDLCIHLGSWPGNRSLERMVAEARSGQHADDRQNNDDQDGRNRAVIEAHAEASRDDVLQALVEARDETAAFVASPDADALGLRPVGSVLGPLPLLTILCAATYELAVHALDLGPAGAGRPPDHMLSSGLASLVDVTGALAARCAITSTAGCVSAQGGWAFAARGADWHSMALPAVPTGWSLVEGHAAVLLDASAGRRSGPALLARRELRLHNVGGLLALAPIIESVPGLPGSHGLGGASRQLAGARRLLRRLPGL